MSLFVWLLPLDLSGMGDPTNSYATVGIALRVSGALKPHNHDKVETPSVGKFLAVKHKTSYQAWPCIISTLPLQFQLKSVSCLPMVISDIHGLPAKILYGYLVIPFLLHVHPIATFLNSLSLVV
jgi:hypothetical protein